MKIAILETDSQRLLWYSDRVGTILDVLSLNSGEVVGPVGSVSPVALEFGRDQGLFEVQDGPDRRYLPIVNAIIIDADEFGTCECGEVATVIRVVGGPFAHWPGNAAVLWGCYNPNCSHRGTTPRPSVEYYPSWVTPRIANEDEINVQSVRSPRPF